jgi:DNA-binding transcriptional MocR family regulator
MKWPDQSGLDIANLATGLDTGPMAPRISSNQLSGLIPAPSGIGGPRYAQLCDAIAALLLDGRVAAGTRLPSERDLAQAVSVSRTTVTATYDELERLGYLERRRGSGSYLRLPIHATFGGPGSRIAIRDSGPEILDLSVACLPAPTGVVEAATMRAAELIGGYTHSDGYYPYGIPALRELVAATYNERGVPTSADNILISNGAQHAIDIVIRALTLPGDRILIELPTYPGAIEAINTRGATAVPVPLAANDGWETEWFTAAIAQHNPRLLYLIPDYHNPTGLLMPHRTREAIVGAARRSGARIIVDESFVDLDLREDDSSPTTAMASLHSSVISIGSLSKRVWGGLRTGWIRADADTVQRLAMTRARSDMSGPIIQQLVSVALFDQIDEIAASRRTDLRRQRDALFGALARRLPSWQPSNAVGGLSSWVRLDAPWATTLTHHLEERGVLITSGSRFAPDGVFERYLRLPFALDPESIEGAVDIIADCWAEIETIPFRTHLVPI